MLQNWPDPGVAIFLTGSRAYGIPRTDSDYDYVVRVSRGVKKDLKALSEVAPTIRIGKLNFITCASDEEFNTWAEGTRRLMEMAPCPRAFAVQVFEELGLRRGVGGAYPTSKLFNEITETLSDLYAKPQPPKLAPTWNKYYTTLITPPGEGVMKWIDMGPTMYTLNKSGTMTGTTMTLKSTGKKETG